MQFPDKSQKVKKIVIFDTLFENAPFDSDQEAHWNFAIFGRKVPKSAQNLGRVSH